MTLKRRRTQEPDGGYRLGKKPLFLILSFREGSAMHTMANCFKRRAAFLNPGRHYGDL